MKKKLLLRDIADQLGVSITTVSFILNGKAKEKRISDKLTQKVLKLVEEVDYKPNQIAQSLRTGKTKTIGLMVEDIANPFFANVARLIEEKAYSKGYKIIYCSTENDTHKTRELIRMFRDKHVDGYIITPPEGVEEEIESLLRNKFPVVLFDRYYPNVNSNHVIVDNLTGTKEAIELFIRQGEKNIAFVTLDSQQTQMVDRLEGYNQAVKSAKKKKLVLKIPYDYSADQMITMIIEFLRKNKTLDAVFFSTNYLGIRGLEAINRIGLRIPRDIRFVAYDDHDLFRLNNPSITAVAQPIEAISNNIINMLLNQLEAPGTTDEDSITKMVLPTNLIIRKSSKKRKNNTNKG